jgi:cobaltochelatase CobN
VTDQRHRIALLSTSDTDLLSARASEADYLLANPAKTSITALQSDLATCAVLILRVLGSPQTYGEEIAKLRAL